MKIEDIHVKLNVLYEQIPDTKGCMENINKEDGCGAWCCLHQQPSVLASEFSLTLQYMFSNYTISKIIDLIEASLRNYLSNQLGKGCVFWNKETKLCDQHESRPLACYSYGITPDEEFNARLKSLRELYDDPNGEYFKDQCPLVSTVDGSEVTTDDTDTWWKKLKEVEREFGTEEKYINDEPGGSYRTYPEHMLLKFFSEGMLDILQVLKINGNDEEKTNIINTYMSYVRKRLTVANNGKKKNNNS